MPHSRQAFSVPSRQMPGSNPKNDLNSIASISASSTISITSSGPSVSKPPDFALKREQNPRCGHDNGLTVATHFQRQNFTDTSRLARPTHQIRTPTNDTCVEAEF